MKSSSISRITYQRIRGFPKPYALYKFAFYLLAYFSFKVDAPASDVIGLVLEGLALWPH